MKTKFLFLNLMLFALSSTVNAECVQQQEETGGGIGNRLLLVPVCWQVVFWVIKWVNLEAMIAFKHRVELVKKHMDNKNVRIVNIHVNTGDGYSRPVYAENRMMAMSGKSASAVEAGTSNITVTVSGSVQYF